MIELKKDYIDSYSIDIIKEIPTNSELVVFPKEKTTNGGGLLVKVVANKSHWIGMFLFGSLMNKGKNGIYSLPEVGKFVVIAKGAGYIVTANDPDDWQKLRLQEVINAYMVKEMDLVLFINPWKICAYSNQGLSWVSDRIAIDGMEVNKIDGGFLFGTVDFLEEQIEFKLDLQNGKHEGGIKN